MGEVAKYLDRLVHDEPDVAARLLKEPMMRFDRWDACLVGAVYRARGQAFTNTVSWRELHVGTCVPRLMLRIRAELLRGLLRAPAWGPHEAKRWQAVTRTAAERLEQMLKARVRRRLMERLGGDRRPAHASLPRRRRRPVSVA